MPITYAHAFDYARRTGRPQLANEIFQRAKFLEAFENGELIDDVSPIAQEIMARPVQKAGDFSSIFGKSLAPLMGESGASPIETLKLSTGTDFDLTPLKKIKPQETEAPGQFAGAVEALAGQAEEEDKGNYVWNALERGFTNDIGFIQATGGLIADAVGAEKLGTWLKEKANLNFEQADSIEASDSTLGWAGELILEQVPSMVMTLGAGWALKAGAKIAFGNTAKAAVKTGLKEAVTGQLVKNGMAKELAEKNVEAVLKDEVVDSIAKVGLRDAFINSGRGSMEKNALAKLGKLGVDVTDDAVKGALATGAKRRALSEVVAPWVGMTAATYGMTTGDIIRDLQQEAERLREAGVDAPDPTFGDVALGGAIASSFDMIPASAFAKKFGLLEGNSLLSRLIREGATDPKTGKILTSVKKEIAKGSLSEGTTEALQGLVSEATKKFYIDKWSTLDEDKKMSLGQYLFRPEAWQRYGEEFLGGAVVGGVFGGVGGAIEKRRNARENQTPEQIQQAEQEFVEKNIEPQNVYDLSGTIAGRANEALGSEAEWTNEAKAMAVAERDIKAERTIKISPEVQNQLDRLNEQRTKLREKPITDKYTEQKKESEIEAVNKQIEDLENKNANAQNRKLQLEQRLKELNEEAANPNITPEGRKVYEDLAADTKAQIELENYKTATSEEAKAYFEPVKILTDEIERTQKSKLFTNEADRAKVVDSLKAQLSDTIAKMPERRAAAFKQQLAEQNNKRRNELLSLDKAGDITPEESVELSYLQNMKNSLYAGNQARAAADAYARDPENTPDRILAMVTPAEMQRLVDEDAITEEQAQLTKSQIEARPDSRGFRISDTFEQPVEPFSIAGAFPEGKDVQPYDFEARDRALLGEPYTGPRLATRPLDQAPPATTQEVATPEVAEEADTGTVGEVEAPTVGVSGRPVQDAAARYITAFNNRQLDPAEEQVAGEELIKQLKAAAVRRRIPRNLDMQEVINRLVDDGALNVTRGQRAVLQNKVMELLDAQDPDNLNAERIDPLFARPTDTEQVSKGTSIENLQNWLSQNTPGFLADAKIEVVTSEQFPGERWQGAYDNGTIYINADTMTDADMKRVLFHEALGHAIAREVLGKDYDSVMKTILSEIKRINAGGKDLTVGGVSVKELLKTYADQLYRKDGSINPKIAEEVWAKYIEAHAEGKLSNKNLLFKIYEAIRDWVIKSMGGEVRTLSAVDRLAARAVRLAEFNALGYENLAGGRAMAINTRGENFRNWFGDSKVVDENGEPLVVYHGTRRLDEETGGAFTLFDTAGPRDPGSHFGTFDAANQKAGDDINARVYPVYLSIKNPVRMDDVFGGLPADVMLEMKQRNLITEAEYVAWRRETGGFNYKEQYASIVSKLEGMGYDGIVYENIAEGEPADSYVAFKPTQIKSVYNKGTFDPNNPDIRFSRPTPEVKPGELNKSIRLFGIALPRKFEKAYGVIEKALPNSSDIGVLDRLFRTKQALAEKFPQLRPLFQELTNASDRHREIFNDLAITAGEFLHGSKEDKRATEKVLIQGDVRGEEYATAQEAGLTEQQFKMYQSVRRAFDKERDMKIADTLRALAMLEKKVAGQDEATLNPSIKRLLKDLREIPGMLRNQVGYFPRVRPQDAEWEVSYKLNGKIYSQYVEGVGSAGVVAKNRLLDELKQQGATGLDGTGTPVAKARPAAYFETATINQSEVGEISNIVTSILDGKMEQNEIEGILKSLFYARGFKKHYLRRQKVNMSDARRGNLPENVELAEGTTLSESYEIDPDTGEMKDTTVIHGYQTTNLTDVLYNHFNGFAGMSSKAITSEKMTEIFTAKDKDGKLIFNPEDKNKLGVYKQAQEFVKAAVAGGDDYSKMVRWANNIMFHAHIGLRFSSSLWNMTHIHMFGTGLLHTEMKKRGLKTPGFLELSKDFGTAHKDAMKFMLAKNKIAKTDPEAKVSLSDMGWGADKADLLSALNEYFMAANGSTLSAQMFEENNTGELNMPSDLAAKYQKWSGWMMHHSEIANKLASFAMHYEKLGPQYKDSKERYNEAKHFVRLLNGSYEKFNMPGYLQGTGFTNKMAQIMLNTFRTHVLNTYEIMGNMWVYDKAAFAYSMAAATIMAGVPGKMLLDELIRLIWGVAEGEDPYKGSFDMMNEQLLGEGTAKFLKGGVMSWLDLVDTSGSIGLGVHPSVEALSYLTGHNRESALAAPFTSFVKAMNGDLPIYKAMPIKGVQSLWQAAYESTYGVEIGRRKIFNSDGTEMKLTPWEALMVAGGINPQRRSDTSSEIWENRQVQMFFDNWKSGILSDAKQARSPVEKMAINKRMKDFNEAVRDAKRNPVYQDVVKSRPVSWSETRRPRNEYQRTGE